MLWIISFSLSSLRLTQRDFRMKINELSSFFFSLCQERSTNCDGQRKKSLEVIFSSLKWKLNISWFFHKYVWLLIFCNKKTLDSIRNQFLLFGIRRKKGNLKYYFLHLKCVAHMGKIKHLIKLFSTIFFFCIESADWDCEERRKKHRSKFIGQHFLITHSTNEVSINVHSHETYTGCRNNS